MRGAVVTVAAPGDYGKPRPAIVIQSDWLSASDSVLVCLLTTTRRAAPFFRLPIEPDASNGLRAPSNVMVDKIIALPRSRIGQTLGQLRSADMRVLNGLLALAIGLVDNPDDR